MRELEKVEDEIVRARGEFNDSSPAIGDPASAELPVSTEPSALNAKVALGTHYFRQKYLCSFATQAEVMNHVRTQALDEEVKRLPEILRE